MKSLGDIVINITANAGKAVAELGRAKDAVQGLDGVTGAMSSKLSSFGRGATALGVKLSLVTAAISGVAAAAFVMAKSAADTGDKVANSAKRAGVSAKYYQEMGFAIGQVADVSDEDFDKAMTKLNRTLGDAMQGSKSATSAFEAVGISAADIAAGTVTTEQAMDALVAKLNDTKDPALAAALATDLLGKNGARMGGLLAGAGAEVASLRERAEALGIVLSDKAVNASERFGASMTELQKSLDGLKMKIAGALLPVLVNDLIPLLTDTVIPAMGKVADKVAEWIDWFGQLPEPVHTAAEVIGLALGVGGPVLIGIGLVSTALSALIGATGPVGLFITAASLAVAAWQLWGDDIKAAVGAAIDYLSQKFQGLMDFLQGIIDKATAVKDAVTNALSFGGSAENPTGPLAGSDPLAAPTGDGAAWRGLPDGGGTTATGTALADGLVNGFRDQMAARGPEISAIIETIPQTARDILQVQSPSQVFYDIGGYIGEGMANGISDSQGLIQQAMAGISDGAIAQTDSMTDGILSGLGTLFQGSKKISAGIAFVSTMQGAAKEMEKGVFGFASATAVIAKGMAFVAAIQGAGHGGGTVGGGGGSGAATAPVAAPPQPLDVRLSGIDASQFYSGSAIQGLLQQLQVAAGDRGMRLLVPQ